MNKVTLETLWKQEGKVVSIHTGVIPKLGDRVLCQNGEILTMQEGICLDSIKGVVTGTYTLEAV